MRQCCIRTQASACTYEKRSDLKLLYCASSGRRPWALARTFCVYIYSTSRRKEGIRNQRQCGGLNAAKADPQASSESFTGIVPGPASCSTESILRLTDGGSLKFRTRTRGPSICSVQKPSVAVINALLFCALPLNLRGYSRALMISPYTEAYRYP